MRAMKAPRFVPTVLAVSLTFTGILATTVSADHRPGNVVVIGGTLALSGRYAEPAELYMNAWKLYVDELNQRGVV